MASLPIIDAIVRGVSPMSFSASAAAPYSEWREGGGREGEGDGEGDGEGGREGGREREWMSESW
jgi:hypothetical protein